MDIEIQLTTAPIAENIAPPSLAAEQGAWLEFRGIVRAEENGQRISALEYEAYPEMAEREIRRILESLGAKNPCLAAKVIHRVGIIPVGETAIYAGVASSHRGEGLALMTEFMNRLKQDVPIWKAKALPEPARQKSPPTRAVASKSKPLSFDEAILEIQSHLNPLPPVRLPLAEAFGHVLRETVCAGEDFPGCDRSTRDGYAILENDLSESFRIVDTLHAADWKPRQLGKGEAMRVATGSALTCENLRVVMQEDVERAGDTIKILHSQNGINVRKRGEEMRKGETVLAEGANLNAGALALLATVGCAQPVVSPRLKVAHFTTGDELVPPGQSPQPGQIRDSNSILIRGLLREFPSDVFQGHLKEDFGTAMAQVASHNSKVENADVLLISGGASVGEKDFTRELLADLGFEIVFNRLNIRPGAPLIFGVNGPRIAFGLPGNPISHLVCFHLFVAAAIKRLTGAEPQKFREGVVAADLDEAPNPREIFIPARLGSNGLRPLKWLSSGDVSCLAGANALIRIPSNAGPMKAGAKVHFLPT